jgi:predicted  nucleic acid-binding Zn-ribbon protein
MDPPDLGADLAALGLEDSELYEENPIPDLLGRELAVKVDKIPWQNVLVDVSDEGEEAVIVLYGLMPGRHYEVELTVVSSKEPLRKHVVTDIDSGEQCPGALPNQEADIPPDGSAEDHSADLADTFSGETAAPKTVSLPLPTPSQVPPSPRSITVEERAAQLRHNLSLLTNETEALLLQLKNARRDTQRAESSLKAEMDALKRSSEKQNATEHRTRQKVLALQEAVKQSLAAAKEAEEEMEQVRASLPAIEAEIVQVQQQHAELKEEAKRSSTETESSINASRKRLTDMQSELSGLTHRLDRLNGKKERLEGETIPEMEKELQALRTLYAELEKGQTRAGIGAGKDRDEPPGLGPPVHLPSGAGPPLKGPGPGPGPGPVSGRLPPIGRPNPDPRLINKVPPRRPGILNVPHLLHRTSQ